MTGTAFKNKPSANQATFIGGRQGKCASGEIVKMTDRRDIHKLCESLYSGKQFRNQATNHGSLNEKTAIKEFSNITDKKIDPCGFFIHPELNFIGASPDGLVQGRAAQSIDREILIRKNGLLK